MIGDFEQPAALAKNFVGDLRMSQRWIRTAVILLVAFTSGCSSSFRLMPAPVYHDTEGYQNLASEYFKDTGEAAPIDVFYATDRAGQTTKDACSYSRDRGDGLYLGVAHMKIGDDDWSIDQLSKAISDQEKLVIGCDRLEEFGLLYSTIPPTSQAGVDAFYSESMDDPVRAASKEFAGRINAKLEKTRVDEVNIFVSGLSTSFGNSVKHASALYHYTGRLGAMVAFPWPVGSTPFSANRDRISGRVSARSLRNLILFLADNTNADHINIIGYSGGAEVVAYALYQLRLTYAGQDSEKILNDLRIRNVILASPDTDYQEFRNMLMDGLLDVADSTTVYVNPKDQVIVFSERFSAGAPRLGNPGQLSDTENTIYRDVDRIAFVSPENGEKNIGVTDSLGHSYWYLNPWVSSDVLLRMTTQLPPEQRGLVRGEGEVVWHFPDDYVERTEALFRDWVQEELEGSD